jgi:hypothetical protein
MRCSTALVTGAITLALAVGAEARGPGFDGPHVRALDPASAALIKDAQQRSATVRDLFKKLQTSDIVAYVRIAPSPEGTPEAGFTFVGMSKAARFVMASISGEAAADRRIELLAHELQHAVDLAGVAWVTSSTQLRRYMNLNGWRDADTGVGYETASACRTERQVRKELHGGGEPQ